jgi:hypothetical protein
MWRLGNDSKSKASVEPGAMAVYPYRKTTESWIVGEGCCSTDVVWVNAQKSDKVNDRK